MKKINSRSEALRIIESLDDVNQQKHNYKNKITIIIKTFERPLCVAKLIQSIYRYKPNIQILVCDDSKQPLYQHKQVLKTYIKWLNIDYEKGHTLGAGRNYLVDKAETEYVFLCDDDHEFTEQTRLQEMLEFLETFNFDIVGGAQGNQEYGAAIFERKDNKIIQKFHSHHGLIGNNCVICDRVSNTFLARTEALKKVRWQEDVYAHEHADFFIHAKNKGLKVAQMGQTWVRHDRKCEENIGFFARLFGRWMSHSDSSYRKKRLGGEANSSEIKAKISASALYKKYVLDVHQITDIVDDYDKKREQDLFKLIGPIAK